MSAAIDWDAVAEKLGTPHEAGLGEPQSGNPAPWAPAAANPVAIDWDAVARRKQRQDVDRALHLALDGPDPDQAAEALRIAGETGVPAEMVRRDLVGLRRRAERLRFDSTALVDQAPATAAFLADPENARVARDDVGPLSRLEGLLKRNVADPLRAGTLRLAQVAGTGAALTTAERLAILDRIDRTEALPRAGIDEATGRRSEPAADKAAELVGPRLPMQPWGDPNRDPLALARLYDDPEISQYAAGDAAARKALRQRLQQGLAHHVAGIVGDEAALAALPQDEGLQRAIQQGTVWAVVDAIIDDPSILLRLPLESLPLMAPGLAAAPIAGPAAIGAGSFLVERNLTVLDVLRDAGATLTEQGLAEAFRDPALMARARDIAARKGGPVGLFDALSAGIVSRTLAPAGMRPLPRAATNLVAQLPVQGAAGAAGEATGQLLSKGEVNPAEVALEALAEIGTAPVEIAMLAGHRRAPAAMALRADVGRMRAAENAQAFLRQLGEAASASRLRQRMPEKFQEWLARAKGSVDSLHIPAEAFATYFQEQGVDPAAVAGELGIGDQLARAREVGGDLVVPLEAYAARLAGSRFHQDLSRHIRLAPGDMTLAEAEAFKGDMVAEIEAEVRRALEADTAVRASDGPAARVFDDVRRQLVEAGRTPDVADREAAVFRAVFATLGERAGIDPWELYRRQGLQLRRSLPESVAGLSDEELDRLLGREGAGSPGGEDLADQTGAPAAESVPPGSAARKPPADGRAFLPDGSAVDVGYELVELASLLTSHTDELAPDPAFPEALQPRDRGRAASGEQISRMAGRLIPELLGQSANAADGAPIVGPDGVVESGNGRVMALRRAYGQDMESAARYRTWLESQGFDVSGMTAPVLVRRRRTELDDEGRAAFARAANARTTASMSAAEQAQADAAALTPEILGLLRSNDIAATANRPFARAFLAQVAAPSELGSFVTEAGELSLDGRRRIRGALLARAYGDMALVERLLEEDEGGLGPLGRALLDVAPRWAALADPDATAALVDATRAVLRQRDAGDPLHFPLHQAEMFGAGLSADARAFLSAFLVMDRKGNSRLAGRERLVATLQAFLGEAEKRGQGPGLTGEAASTTAEILEALGGREQRQLQKLVEELGLDPATVTAAELRAATSTGDADGALFQPMRADVDLDAELTITVAEPRFQGRAYREARDGFPPSLIAEIAEGGPYRNEHHGWEIRVSRGALRHAIKRGDKSDGKAGSLPREMVERLEALANLPHLLRRARAIESRSTKKGAGAPLEGVHRLYAPIEIGGRLFTARITVKEYASQRAEVEDIDLLAYDLALEREVPAGTSDQRSRHARRATAGTPSPEGISEQGTPGDSATPARPTTGSITVREALDGVKDDEGNPYFQRAPKGARGAISFLPDGRTLIQLFEHANLSTVLHESGHLFLEVLRQVATAEDAPEALRQDWQTVLEWLGVPEGSAIGTAQHEQWARGFEAWLMEGKAPSLALQSVFDRFRAWLTRIYRTLRGLDVQLSDEVRRVFDRLLATDQEIETAEAASRFAPLLADPAGAGMTPAEHAAYLASAEKATAAAKRSLIARAMADIRRERTATWKADEAAIAAEVEAELDRRPVYRALRYFETGELPGVDGTLPDELHGLRIDRAALVETSGHEVADRLAAAHPSAIADLASKPAHPDHLAELLGFDSGDAMAQALASAPSRAEIAKAETARRMRERHGDMLDEGRIAEAAIEAVHGDARAEFLSLELAALARRAGMGSTPTPLAVIRDSAARFVAGSKVGMILRHDRHLHTSQRWAREAQRAVAAGDFQAATEAKRRQLFHFAAFQEARKAAREVDKALDRFARLSRPETARKLPAAYNDQIAALLARFDLRRSIPAKAARERQALADWIRQQEEAGLQVDIPDHLRNEAFRQPYREMTVEDFRGLADAVDQLAHLARQDGQLLAAQRQASLEEAAEEIVASIGGAGDRPPTDGGDFAPQRFEGVRRWAKAFMAAHLKLEFVFERLDGFRHGAAWHHLFKPLADAENAESTRMATVSAELRRIFGRYSRLERVAMHTRRIHVPELGRSFTKSSLLALALNWGNEGNRVAVMRGYGWTAGQVEQALARLDRRDWDTVQAVWDLVDSFWPDIEALQRDLAGRAPDKVRATPIETPHGLFRGGYYPLHYDPERSWLAFRREEERSVKELFGGNWSRAATRQGHTKARVGSAGQPVRLDLSVLGTHLGNVVHDLTHRRAIIDVMRLAEHGDVRAAIETAAGRDVYRLIKPWLVNIAAGRTEPVAPVERVAAHARTGTTIVNMGLKLTTALAQPLGWLTTVSHLGPRWATKGLIGFYGNPGAMQQKVDFVLERSEMMRHRRQSFDRDVQDTLRRLTKSGPLNGVEQSFFWLTGLMDMGVALPTWLGAFEQALAERNGDEAAAATYADSIVRMTQSAGGAKDLAAIQRGPEYAKLLTMFYSYFSVLYNQFARETGQVKADPSTWPHLFSSMIFLWFVPAILGELIAGRGPDDDEDWLTWSGKTLALYPFQAVVGIRDLASGALGDYGYDISPAVAAFAGLAGTFKTAVEGDELTRAEAREIFLTASIWGRLPGRQIWITGEAFHDWLTGDWQPESLGEALRYGLLQRRPADARP
mgnify:CR=1 FL=1